MGCLPYLEEIVRYSLVHSVSRWSRRTLNFGLDIVNSIGRLHLKGDSLTREGLDEDLHDEDLEEKRQVSSLLLRGCARAPERRRAV